MHQWPQRSSAARKALAGFDYVPYKSGDSCGYWTNRILSDFKSQIEHALGGDEPTLYYQSIRPYYLADCFRIGGSRPNTRRLYYLTSNLNCQNTPFADWKLMIASASAPVGTVSRH
jgi:hypothetical protein